MSNPSLNLSESDMQMLLNALSTSSLSNKGKGKNKGMSMEYKNALINKLSATAEPPKVISDSMTDDEKKAHREALRRKLHEKTNTLQTARGSKVVKNKLYEDSLSKLNLSMPSQPGPVPPEVPLAQPEPEHQQEENLDDFTK
jgi:hypothetical protein